MELAYLLEPSFQIVDKSGNPLSNGYIEVYIAGTSTKYYCYSDFGGSLHPFRIPLDALGSNIILANTGLIYDVFIYNQFGTMVMSRHRVTSKITSSTSGHSYIVVEGTEGQITVESSGSTDITYKVGLDDDIINELSGIHSDISSTSSYFENKINNLDIHNINIESSGTGNAFTSFTKNGDTYTFKKEETFLPSDKAPIVLAGENVEVTAANTDGRTIYTIKANPAGNVTNLISTDDTVSISATSVGNDVTYDLSVKDIAGENGAKNYAFLKSEMPVNTSQMALEYTDVHTNGIHWNTIDQRLEFDEQIKLIDLNFNLAYEIDTANGISYEDLILYILSDGQVLEQQTYSIDTSKAKFVCIWNKKILDPSNLQFMVKAPKAGTVDASIDVNDETFKSIGSSVSGSTYYAGSNINITDDVISGRDWTPELNNKLDTSAFALPNSANWDNTYNTVLANSATWNEGGQGSTYSAGSNINITDNVISGKDWSNEINEYKFDVEVSNTEELRAALLNPDVHFINVITDTCEIRNFYPGTTVKGDKYIYGKKIFFKFHAIYLDKYKLFFLNEGCENTTDTDYQGKFYANLSDAGVYIKNLYGGSKVNKYHAQQPGTYVYQTGPGNVTTDFTQSNWVTPELENLNRVKYNNERLDNVYDTVNSNSAQWSYDLYSSDGSLSISTNGSAYDLKLNQYIFDVEVSNTEELRAAFFNPDVHFINVITDTCELNGHENDDEYVHGDKYIYGKKIFFKFRHFDIQGHKLFFLNEGCENIGVTYDFGFFVGWDSNAAVYIKNLYGVGDITHQFQPGTYIYQTISGDVTTNFTQSNWVTPELENINRVKYIDKYDNVYDTVSSNSATWDNTYNTVLANSATWNEGGGQGSTYSAGSNIDITYNTISGKDWSNEINAKLDTTSFTLPNSANWDDTYNTVNSNSANWSNDTTYTAGPNINITDNTISGKDWSPELNNKLDTSAFDLPNSANWDNTYNTVSSNSATWNEGGGSLELSCENFVEWNFNRQSSITRSAYPLLALCDTSGTQSGTLNAGDKYMIYVDGLIGQSGNSNNTFVNFGIQSGTVSGQYLLPEPLPSKKLCRSTSTGNDFACSYMFTVPTNGTYSVAVAPDDNNNEYKFFGNTTVRQIKIG